MLNSRTVLEAWRPENWRPRSLRLRRRGGSRDWNVRRAVLGIEVRATSLYLACVHPGLVRAVVAGTDVISGYTELRPEELRARLSAFLKPFKVEDPVVVLALPRSEVIVRILSLPLVARKSVQEALALQAEMFKPTDTEEFCWDSASLSVDDQVTASLVMAPRATIERLVNLFAAAGHPINVLNVGQFSLLHLFLRGQQPLARQRSVLLDFKGPDAELALLEGRKLLYSRAFAVSNEDPSIEKSVISEIQRAASTLRWHEGAQPTVFLSGSVPASVESALGMVGPVEHLERKLQSGERTPDTCLGECLGAVAVALAGSGRSGSSYRLNLLPAELRQVRQRRWHHVPTYALLAASAFLLVGLAARRPLQDHMLLRQYEKQIASLKRQTDEMNGILQEDRKLRQELIVLEEFQQGGRQPLDALNDVAQRLPSEAWLNLFTYRKGQIELMGSAKSASSLLPLLQASPRFEDVKFDGALTQDPSGGERFRIQMRLKGRR
jgi:Tfp pilus assembly PilM family ATPase/Tfp pilus assembly protein PilN